MVVDGSLWFVTSGIFHCYMEFASLKGTPGADVTIKDLGLQTDFSIYLQIRQTWLAFSEHTAHTSTHPTPPHTSNTPQTLPHIQPHTPYPP